MRVAFFLTLLALACSTVSAQWYVTGVGAGNSGWLIAQGSANATATLNPSITAANPSTLTFILTQNFTSHPFAFAQNDAAAVDDFAGSQTGCNNASNVFSAINADVAPCIITFDITPADVPAQVNFIYKCTLHAAMKGAVTLSAPGATTTAPPTNGTTTVPPTTTSPPTTPAPKNNNSAAVSAVSMPALTSIVLAAAAAVYVA